MSEKERLECAVLAAAVTWAINESAPTATAWKRHLEESARDLLRFYRRGEAKEAAK